MINRLINMDVKPFKSNIITSSGDYTIQQYAYSFLSGLSKSQKARFKQMLENGIEAGMSVASTYGVDYTEFIQEVKNQLKIGGK